jgi:hypothetical protein
VRFTRSSCGSVSAIVSSTPLTLDDYRFLAEVGLDGASQASAITAYVAARSASYPTPRLPPRRQAQLDAEALRAGDDADLGGVAVQRGQAPPHVL